jgi:hypothetical protein
VKRINKNTDSEHRSRGAFLMQRLRRHYLPRLLPGGQVFTFTRGQKWSRIKIEASIELSFAFF